MGFFDISLHKDIGLDKNQLSELKNSLDKHSFQSKVVNNRLEVSNFQLDSSWLKYNLTIQSYKNKLLINGELQQVIVLTVLIVLAILLTYGFGVVLVVAYTYYQKRAATKYLEEVVEKLQRSRLSE
jgi:hypothetical protein